MALSDLYDNARRPLKVEEKNIIKFMLKALNNDILQKLEAYSVLNLNDGGMGSIQVAVDGKDKRRFGNCIAEAKYTDKDNIPVFISINIDDSNEFYELEFWKVDYSSLLKYPNPEELELLP